MKHLVDIIKEIVETTQRIKKENKYVDNIWYDVQNVPIDELREVAEEYGTELGFSESHKKMRLQISLPLSDTTIFCYSKEVKVKTHIVIDEAYKNI